MPPKRTTQFYMANLGPELSRAFSFMEKGATDQMNGALLRSEDILSKILAMETSVNRKEEIKIISLIIDDLKKPTRELLVSKIECENYFMPFALALTRI